VFEPPHFSRGELANGGRAGIELGVDAGCPHQTRHAPSDTQSLSATQPRHQPPRRGTIPPPQPRRNRIESLQRVEKG